MKENNCTCSRCGFVQKEGQNFCGACGHTLENICPGCKAHNPPVYSFCGQCGKDLRVMGLLTLDRTGLITAIDETATSILQGAGGNLPGKPFSIFVSVTDRAFFFSCWNMALNSSQQQELEVELKLRPDRAITCRLVLKPADQTGETVHRVHLEIEDTTDRHKTQHLLEEKEKLLEIISTLTDAFHPSKRKNRQQTINTVLAQIGAGSNVQSAFVARIDTVSKLLFSEFTWQRPNALQSTGAITTLSLDAIRPVFGCLQRGSTYIAKDFGTLSPGECQLWQRWLPRVSSIGSIACELIYREHHPVGIIGLVRSEKGSWPQTTILLMQLAAQLISETLPKNVSTSTGDDYRNDSVILDSEDEIFFQSGDVNDFDDIEAFLDDDYTVQATGAPRAEMLVEAVTAGTPDGAHPVFATDEGVYAIRCPQCEQTELVSANHFDQQGWILGVTCICGNSFRIIREMRKVFRKQVQLSGSFGRSTDGLSRLETPGKWSSMEVTNLSKNGLNFTSPMSRLLHVGDNIQLKFHLDNSTRSLINKSALIKSVRKNNVGCQFENSDKPDTTLGFYFL